MEGPNPTTRPNSKPFAVNTLAAKLNRPYKKPCKNADKTAVNKLELFRRHYGDCPYKTIDQSRCNCPVWCYGYLDGRRIRKSLKTHSWTEAMEKIGRLEQEGTAALPREIGLFPAPTIADAAASFLADCQARQLRPATMKSYRDALTHLCEFCGGNRLDALTLTTLTDFRAHRKVSPSTSRKEIQLLRVFCGWLVDREAIPTNPARRLRPPREQQSPTLPFTAEECAALIDACVRITDGHNHVAEARARLRARAIVLLLLHTGVRVGDLAQMRWDQIIDDRVVLRTEKTGARVSIPLPAVVLEALDPLRNGTQFIFQGRSQQTTVRSIQRTLAMLGTLAGVVECRPHRFRDTFACNLLLAGADLRTVQLLLGHASITVTSRHYAPFVAAQQRLLDEAIGRLTA